MWLTPEKKQECLEKLARELDANCVDVAMLPQLQRFNSFGGCVTVSSCQGHAERDREPYVTLRVDRRTALRFFDNAGEIVRESPEIRVYLSVVRDPPYDADMHVRLEGRHTVTFLQGLDRISERMLQWTLEEILE